MSNNRDLHQPQSPPSMMSQDQNSNNDWRTLDNNDWRTLDNNDWRTHDNTPNLRNFPRPPTPYHFEERQRSSHRAQQPRVINETEQLRILEEFANRIVLPYNNITHLTRLPFPQRMIIMDPNMNSSRTRSRRSAPYYVPFGYVTHIARFQPDEEFLRMAQPAWPNDRVPPNHEHRGNTEMGTQTSDEDDIDTYTEYTVGDSEYESDFDSDSDDYEFDLELTLTDIEEDPQNILRGGRGPNLELDLTLQEEIRCQVVIKPDGVIKMRNSE